MFHPQLLVLTSLINSPHITPTPTLLLQGVYQPAQLISHPSSSSPLSLRQETHSTVFDAYTLWQLTHSGRGGSSSPCRPRGWQAGCLGNVQRASLPSPFPFLPCCAAGNFNEIPDQCLFSWGHHGNASKESASPTLPPPPLLANAVSALRYSHSHSHCEGSCTVRRVPQTQTRVPHNFLQNESINEAFRGQLRVVNRGSTEGLIYPLFPALSFFLLSCTASAIYSSVYFQSSVFGLQVGTASSAHTIPSLCFNSKILFWFIKNIFL